MEWIDGKKDERENRRARLLSISPFPVLEKMRKKRSLLSHLDVYIRVHTRLNERLNQTLNRCLAG